MDDGGEVTHTNVLLTSGSEIKIQGAATQSQPVLSLIFIPSLAIPASKDKCIWLENPNLYMTPISGLKQPAGLNNTPKENCLLSEYCTSYY